MATFTNVTLSHDKLSTISLNVKEREYLNFEDTASALQYIAALLCIPVYSDKVNTLEQTEVERDGKVTIRPQVSSIILKKGFLNFTARGSIYFSNNGKTVNVGRLDKDCEFIEGDNSSEVIHALQNDESPYVN